MKALLTTLLVTVLLEGALYGCEQEWSADNQDRREDAGAPWGEQVNGLRMRLTTVGDEKSARNPQLALELQNISPKPFWLERLVDTCHVEATDTSGKRLVIRDLVAPPGPWTTRKADIQPGEILRWTESYNRFGIVWPADGDQQVRLRFGIGLRHARADEPELSVYTNWLTLPTPKPHEIAGEEDLPIVWGPTSTVTV